MSFHNKTTPISITAEVVEAVMKHKNIGEKAVLFLLGFRLDSNLMSKFHKVRHPQKPYLIYETKVFHGLLRNKVQQARDEFGNITAARNSKGHILYTEEYHHMELTYATYTVVGMQDVSKHDLINITDFGNPEAVY